MSGRAGGERGAERSGAARALRLLSVLLAAQLALGPAAWAQVVRDGSIGPAGGGLVPSGTDDLGQPATYLIEDTLGEQVGGNLFHSFSQFDVQATETATFTSASPTPVDTILSRVTGPNPAHIYGRLRSTIPGAGLFLLSPSGIVVGPGAVIDVPGSVAFTTADHLKHSDLAGTRFTATASPSPVLVSQPVQAFGFLDATIAPIEVQGADLAVPAGEALLLVGGNIDLWPGSRLTAPSGGVVLASVASQGTAGLSAPGQPLDVNTGGVASLGNISITGGSRIDSSGDPAGRVVIRAGQLALDDSSVHADTTGTTDSSGTGVVLEARGQLLLSNGAEVRADPLDAGASADLEVHADHLELADDSLIGSRAAAGGRAGDLSVQATSIRLVDGGQLRATAGTGSSGDAGDLTLTADTLDVDDGLVQTTTFGDGDAGRLDVDVRRLDVRNTGALFASSPSSSFAGSAGVIDVNADTITLDDGRIAVETLGPGQGGDVSLTAQDVTLTRGGRVLATSYDGINPTTGDAGSIHVTASGTFSASGANAGGTHSGLYAASEEIGSSGRIDVQAGDIHLADGAIVSTTAFSGSSGDAGVVTLDATQAITIERDAGVYSATSGSGNAGSISLSAPVIRVASDGRVEARTFSTNPGNAGHIAIAADTLELDDGLLTVRSSGAGDAGTIDVTATRVDLTQGAEVLADTFFSSSTGNAGDVTIRADTVELNDSFVRAVTRGHGDAGTVRFDVHDLNVTNGGQANSGAFLDSTGDAGLVEVRATGDVIVTGEDVFGNDSWLSVDTNAMGAGGRVDIAADRLFVGDVANVSADATSSSSGNAGTVTVDAATSILVEDLGGIFADTTSTGDAGQILLTAPSILIRDSGRVQARTFSSNTGNAGSVTVHADLLRLESSGEILARTSGAGNAGRVDVVAKQIELDSFGRIVADTFFSTSTGDAGSITIAADSLAMDDGTISANTDGSGAAGTINIDTNSLRSADGDIVANSDSGLGDAGSIVIRADRIDMTDDATVGARVYAGGAGNAGTIDLEADTLLVDDSTIWTRTADAGDGGLIDIDVRELILRNGADIRSDTFFSNSTGDAGTIDITADLIDMDDSTLSVVTRGRGAGGTIGIAVGDLLLTDGSIIVGDSNSGSSGAAGTVSVNARGLVHLGGGAKNWLSSDTFASGHAGTVNVVAESILVEEGEIAARTSSSSSGDGGHVSLTADTITVDDGLVRSISFGSGNGGDVTIRTGDLALINGGQMSGSAAGSSGIPGTVDIVATGSVLLRGSDAAGFPSGIFSVNNEGAAQGGGIRISAVDLTVSDGAFLSSEINGPGDAAPIDIDVARLVLSDQAQIKSSATFGSSGRAGDIIVRASESVTISDGPATHLFDRAGLFSDIAGSGSSGRISISTPVLTVTTGTVQTATSSAADAGRIDIFVDRLELIDSGRISASVHTSTKGGSAGTVNVVASESVLIRGEARDFASALVSSAQGPSQGGDVIVTAPRVVLDDGGLITASTLDSGSAGTVRLDVGELTILDGGQVTTSSLGSGNAGTITVNATDRVAISRAPGTNLTGVLSRGRFGTGDAGSITLTTPLLEMWGLGAIETTASGGGSAGTIDLRLGELSMSDQAVISSSVLAGSGDAGSLKVAVSGPVSISGSGAGLFTESLGSGAGGDIDLTASQLGLRQGAQISARSGSAGGPTSTAGDISLSMRDLLRLESSSISTDSTSSDGGNIDVSAAAVELFDSTISASVDGGPTTTGGNINIAFPNWVILQYASGIIANAFQGQGGSIDVSTKALLVAPDSTIDASSQLGVSGTVAVDAPDTNLAGSLAPLSDRYLGAVQLRKNRCAELSTDDPGSFVLGAGSGVPATPDAPLSGLPLGRGGEGP